MVNVAMIVILELGHTQICLANMLRWHHTSPIMAFLAFQEHSEKHVLKNACLWTWHIVKTTSHIQKCGLYTHAPTLPSQSGNNSTGQGTNSASKLASMCLEWIDSMLRTTRSRLRSSATSPTTAAGILPSPNRSKRENSSQPPDTSHQKWTTIIPTLVFVIIPY